MKKYLFFIVLILLSFFSFACDENKTNNSVTLEEWDSILNPDEFINCIVQCHKFTCYYDGNIVYLTIKGTNEEYISRITYENDVNIVEKFTKNEDGKFVQFNYDCAYDTLLSGEFVSYFLVNLDYNIYIYDCESDSYKSSFVIINEYINEKYYYYNNFYEIKFQDKKIKQIIITGINNQIYSDYIIISDYNNVSNNYYRNLISLKTTK